MYARGALANPTVFAGDESTQKYPDPKLGFDQTHPLFPICQEYVLLSTFYGAHPSASKYTLMAMLKEARVLQRNPAVAISVIK